MGTRGARQDQARLLGSVSDYVMRNAPVPGDRHRSGELTHTSPPTLPPIRCRRGRELQFDVGKVRNDSVVARVRDRVVAQGRRRPGAPHTKMPDAAVVEPRVGDHGVVRAALDHAPVSQCSASCCSTRLPARRPRRSPRASSCHARLRYSERVARVEQVDAEPARLVAVVLDARADGLHALDRAQVVAALVLGDDVTGAARDTMPAPHRRPC